jgi:hypothetical protein
MVFTFCVDWRSVGIPHKEAAVGCCDEVHPLAKVRKVSLQLLLLLLFFLFFSFNIISLQVHF